MVHTRKPMKGGRKYHRPKFLYCVIVFTYKWKCRSMPQDMRFYLVHGRSVFFWLFRFIKQFARPFFPLLWIEFLILNKSWKKMKMEWGGPVKRGEMVKGGRSYILSRGILFFLCVVILWRRRESHLMCVSIILRAAIQAISLTVDIGPWSTTSFDH